MTDVSDTVLGCSPSLPTKGVESGWGEKTYAQKDFENMKRAGGYEDNGRDTHLEELIITLDQLCS